MSICPITYLPCEGRYSAKGLKLLSRKLEKLNPFPFTAEQQIREAGIRASKMSIQGVQPKLSAVLDVRHSIFQVVDTGGHFILIPQNPIFPELPENEDVTMRMAQMIGIETPLHGLMDSKDGSFTYFIKRFDRIGAKGKLPLEDFSQLMSLSRDTKYDGSMEKVIRVVNDFCTFPAIERLKLFRLTLFNYLTGNEDMHLKNFSLITRSKKIELSPAYDLLNSTIAIGKATEEIALPVKGKKSRLTREVLIDYFGKERLDLNDRAISKMLKNIEGAFPEWESLLKICFLSDEMKQRYLNLMKIRLDAIF